MNLAVAPQRELARPSIAPVPMPKLDVPAIEYPDMTHKGSTLPQLGEPPTNDSDRAARDMRITKQVIAQRTHEGNQWARDMDLHGTTAIWKELATQVEGDPAVTQAVLGAALSAASVQGGVGKKQWMRQRPFQVDPTIDVIGRTPKLTDSSYPSIHSARAFAAARVLSVLDPSVTDAAYSMAREVALSRIYAGVHFASDTVAGARLGTYLAETTLDRWRAGELPIAPDSTVMVEPPVAA
ncbi:MAG: phosphoesterase [Thermoleophilia bacterium]|nr:phosphoesterase [Thermoleophilia bacterium]